MPELLNDDIIKDFLADYARLKHFQESHQIAQDVVVQRLPVYMRRFRTLAQRMTQEDLANALNVDHSYISKIENGHMKPGSAFLDDLVKFVHAWDEQ